MINLIDNISNSSVLVVGDVMLDKYIYGNVSRISPEAPVPVLKAEIEKERLGGAANVANNVSMLNANCTLVGVAGCDIHRSIIESKLKEKKIRYYLADAGVCTTTKIRIIGERQQIVRIDYEEPTKHSNELSQSLDGAILKYIPMSDIVVISDYGKGLMSANFTEKVIKYTNSFGKITIVDPKGSDWSKYVGATIVTPNVKELGEIAGFKVKNTDESVVEHGRAVRKKFNLKYLVVTRSEKGITVISEDEVVHMKTQAQEVFDVSGAGDTVVATMACALGSGAGIIDAVAIANNAAGVVVSKMGTVPITYAELMQSIQKNDSSALALDKLLIFLEDHRELGHKLVFTNGCFDVLHRGHADYLKKAKGLGDVLIVGLNSDDSVRKLKGSGRPVNSQEDRAFLLSSLESVDYVVIFDEDTPKNLIEKIKPDYLVKGGDYNPDEVVGKEDAGEVVIIDYVDGYSTTNTITKLKGENA